MARVRNAVAPTPLAAVRESLGRMQAQAERLMAKVRRDAEAFMARTRSGFAKDIRDLERRLLKSLHAATREEVARLERRIGKLEDAIAEMKKPGGMGDERAA
jgi:BMFP domain-containing protein YqiC